MRRRLSEQELANIRYEIITGDLSKHAAYPYWLSKWPDLVKALGSEEELTPDDFLKQQKLTVLSLGDEIVAIHMLSEYDRRDFSKHPYFKPYGQAFFSELDKRSVKRVQTLQWLMADEAFVGYGFGAVIVCLSLRNQIEAGVDASITIARADNSVTNLAIKAGMEVIASDVLHNVPVSHMACFTPLTYPKEQIAKLVDHYWAKREYLEIDFNNAKKAA